MTAHRTPSFGPRDVLRWWPLILLPAVLAVAAAVWSVGHQTTMYTAGTRLVVIPLAQWDETFLGTSLIRDAGDANSTTRTVAAMLDTPREAAAAAEVLGGDWTPESVDDAVKVVVVPDSNLIDIQARSTDPLRASKVADEYAKTLLADRWRTISAELDARIAALTATTSPDPNTGDASARLQTLNVIRQGGTDPTLRMDSASAPVADSRLPVALVVGLAAAGGLLVGAFCAFAVARTRRRPVAASELDLDAESTPAYSPNGRG